MGFHHIPKPPRIIAPGGPVSAALRTMLANVEACDRQRLRDLRQRIADRIEADLALLDAIDPFADERESDFILFARGPDGFSLEGVASDMEPSLCGAGSHERGGNQPAFPQHGSALDCEQDAGDEGEVEDEHGGDIQDEPHDEEPDREPSLCGLTVRVDGFHNPHVYDDGEPSLASLGGTAAGREQPQTRWSGGGMQDRELSAPSKVHRQESLWREPGAALVEARQKARDISRPRSASRVVDLRFLGRF